MRRRLSLLTLIFIVVAIVALPELGRRAERRIAIEVQESVTLPPFSTSVPSVSERARTTAEPPASQGLDAILLPVPFIVQAPGQVWDPLHQEACEEASILMALEYAGSRSRSTTPAMQDAALQSLVRRAEELGFPVDLTAEQTALLLRDQDPSLRVSLLRDPTKEQLQASLRAGSIVLIPAAGRALGNPYFRRPGPLYHMLVLRGFTADGYAITNDPGTKNGEAFVYRWETLLDANHDWNGGDVERGERAVVVVEKH